MKFDAKLWVVFAIQPVRFSPEVLWCSLECTPPCQGGGREFKSRQDRLTHSKLRLAFSQNQDRGSGSSVGRATA